MDNLGEFNRDVSIGGAGCENLLGARNVENEWTLRVVVLMRI